jgi:hypothetical protein
VIGPDEFTEAVKKIPRGCAAVGEKVGLDGAAVRKWTFRGVPFYRETQVRAVLMELGGAPVQAGPNGTFTAQHLETLRGEMGSDRKIADALGITSGMARFMRTKRDKLRQTTVEKYLPGVKVLWARYVSKESMVNEPVKVTTTRGKHPKPATAPAASATTVPAAVQLRAGMRLQVSPTDFYEVREIDGNRLVMERWAKLSEVVIDPLDHGLTSTEQQNLGATIARELKRTE